MELVSIVVPIYNVEQYLEKCVESICRQTYENLEIILVNDGSPDHCGQMCEEYAKKDNRIKVIHKKNGGLSDARNSGVKLATGKYLLFVDSDDYIAKDLVEKTAAIAEKNNCDMVLYDYYYVEPDNVEIRSTIVPANKVISLEQEHTLLLAATSACAKLFNREFYVKANCPFPQGIYFEDLATTSIFFMRAKRVYYLKEPLYYYINRENSIMTGKNFEKSSHDKLVALEHILSAYKKEGKYEEYRQELEYLVFANEYFEPSKVLALAGEDGEYLEKYRKYMYETFPDIHNNKYVKNMEKKDKIHLWILDHKQYWMMRLLSKARKMILG